uniref:F-box domain-containing protein n=1 Tax=Salix viminalis TaxID=40686 RepID=A0A6N2MU63_SALVM
MWSHLPFDLLANIFSFLPPDSLARARTACRYWLTCATSCPLSTAASMVRHHQAWFLALPTRSHGLCCYLHNPNADRWHELSLGFQPEPTRPVAPIGSLILSRPADSTALRLAICNPLTKEFRYLPQLAVARTNPAVGVVILGPAQHSPFLHFRVYVAGGMSAAPRGAATYVPTVEVYDSEDDAWRIAGPMPVEFAVRLTVWTPNESVYSEGVLYWMTSARAYSIMGFEIKSNKWQELSVPMADKLEFAALAQLDGRLALVGGRSGGGDACVWELDERHVWSLKEKMPAELGRRILGGRASWAATKCARGDGALCLYRDLGSGMAVWRASRRGRATGMVLGRGVLLHKRQTSAELAG